MHYIQYVTMQNFWVYFLLLTGLNMTGQIQHESFNEIKSHHDTSFNGNDTLYIYINFEGIKISYQKKGKELPEFFKKINDSLVQKGFIFNRLQPDSIISVKGKTILFYTSIKEKKTKVDSVVLSGIKKPPKNYIKYFNRHFKHRILNQKNLHQIQNEFNNDRHFALQKAPFVNFKKGQNILILPLKKSQLNTVSGLIGLTYDAQKEKAVFNGLLNLSLHNILNTGEVLNIKWQKDLSYQSLDLNIDFHKIKGSNWAFSNHFYSSRTDTITASLANHSLLSFGYKRQGLGITYTKILQSRPGQTNINQNFAGLDYRIDLKNPNQFKSFVQLNIKSDITQLKNSILFCQIAYFQKINGNFGWKLHAGSFYNSGNNPGIIYNLNDNLLRKNIRSEMDFHAIYSFKNDIIYHTKSASFYLIGDLIRKDNLKNITLSYINTGIGMVIFNKKQILTFEIIKPLNLGYNTDYQDVYINFKQSVRF